MTDDDKTRRIPPNEDSTETLRPPECPEEHIGPYRILQKIGEGGMGEVWLAEQQKPIRRRVALKIIKRGMDTAQVIARFEAERQALALMNHTNVAKVFDAGSTPRGRPYFAMEYVEGVPITEYCDRHRLTTNERLELFLRVCEGVQHAHQNAIIHRDIKPSNVLVMTQDDKRVPKIIDFGVAKATAQRLTERTVYTELGQLIGTPEYMSPEQAEMTPESVDTRTDVYSLGIVLYELLVGALPFDSQELRRAGFDEIRRRIREEEPSKPSTKISTLGERATTAARNRRLDPKSLAKRLRRDLDWITMKALEKDRTRRYSSPAELADDIERYSRDEPVVAGPPTVSYRAKKFAVRNRVKAAISVALLLFGLAAITAVTATRHARRQTIKAHLEELRREEATAISGIQSGESYPEELAPIIARLEQRLLNGSSTPIDEYHFITALTAIERFGRLLQPASKTKVGFQIGNRGGTGTTGALGVLVDVQFKGEGVVLPDTRRAVLRYSSGGSTTLGFLLPPQQALGRHRVGATVECCLVRLPDQRELDDIERASNSSGVKGSFGGSVTWSSYLAQALVDSVSCLGASFYLDVPEIEFVVLPELPTGFPVPIDAPELARRFLDEIDIGPFHIDRTACPPAPSVLHVGTPRPPLPADWKWIMKSDSGWSLSGHVAGFTSRPDRTELEIEFLLSEEMKKGVVENPEQELQLVMEPDLDRLKSDQEVEYFLDVTHSWPVEVVLDDPVNVRGARKPGRTQTRNETP